jgi:hypothetical protein
VRRTRIRRGRAEIGLAAKSIGVETIDITGNPAIYPRFADHCQTC